jgi:phasin family protein
MLTVEQVMASHKANIETLVGLTGKAFEGVEKIVELNLTASKAALAEIGDHAKAVLSVKDAQELLALQSGMLQPLAEKTAAYSRHLYDIASGSTAELVDTAAKNAPAGSETAVAVMKSAVAAANNALESVQKAVKQATEVAESNFNSVAANAVNATKTATKKR